jgi:hypothetical protein
MLATCAPVRSAQPHECREADSSLRSRRQRQDSPLRTQHVGPLGDAVDLPKTWEVSETTEVLAMAAPR